MKLVTYRDEDSVLRTLMVDEFRDLYNTKDGYMVLYKLGTIRVELPAESIMMDCEIDPLWVKATIAPWA